MTARFSGSAHPKGVPTEYLGHAYDSKLEARYAAGLEMRRLAGEIASWEPHPVPVAIIVNGTKLGAWRPDFRYVEKGGREVLVECKGRWTALGRFKMRLLRVLYPALMVEVHGEAMDKRTGPRGAKRKVPVSK